MPYYLAPYVGAGTDLDSFRPRGSEQPGWAATDIRPDGGATLDGGGLNACFLYLPVADPQPQLRLLALESGELLGPGLRQLLATQLKLPALPVATRFDDLVMELLLAPSVNGWKPLRPTRAGAYDVHLGGLLKRMPILRGGSLIAESFNKADADTLGPDLSWTEVLGDLDVLSNHCVVGTNHDTVAELARADTDLATDDHYAELLLVELTGGTSSTAGLGVGCRKDSSATHTLYWYRAVLTSTPTNEHQLFKTVAGASTQLGSSDATDVAAGEILAIEANGSSITGRRNSVVSVGPVTDTAIVNNLRAGIRNFVTTGTGIARLKPWRAGDLSSIRYLGGGVQTTPGGAHATSVAVTIPATMAGSTLVVTISNGDDPNPAAAVDALTATGANFVNKGTITNSTGTRQVRETIFIAEDVDAGITSVLVEWLATTVGVACVAEIPNVLSLGQVVTATGSGANPTISLTTVDPNNMMIAGFANEDTAQSGFSVASAGMFRLQGYGAGDGLPDVPGCLVDNVRPAAGSLSCTLTYAATIIWAAMAIELRSVGGAAALDDTAWTVQAHRERRLIGV